MSVPENKMLEDLSVIQKAYLLRLQADPVFLGLIRALPRSRPLRYRPKQDNKLEEFAYQSGLLDGEARIVQLLTNDTDR